MLTFLFQQFPFWPIALAAQMVGGSSPSVQFTTPGAGSFVVARSCDLVRWECAYTGHVYGKSRVTARIAADATCEFYAVGFVADSWSK